MQSSKHNAMAVVARSSVLASQPEWLAPEAYRCTSGMNNSSVDVYSFAVIMCGPAHAAEHRRVHCLKLYNYADVPVMRLWNLIPFYNFPKN